MESIMESIMNVIILIIVVGLVVGILILISKNMIYFSPSEILAVPQFRKSTDKADADGETIYQEYSYQKGGKKFIPFWKEYYILDIFLMSLTIKTNKFLTLDKVDIKVSCFIQYQIDISKKENIEKAFETFAYAVQHKKGNTTKGNSAKGNTLEDGTQNTFKSSFEDLLKGTIPEIVGKMTIDELLKNRNQAADNILHSIKKSFLENGLAVAALKIENIMIENALYYEVLNKTIVEEQVRTLAIAENETASIRASLKHHQIERELKEQETQFKVDYSKIEIASNLKRAKIEQHELLRNSHQEEEEYNKSVILSHERAKKDAELVVKKIEFEIAEVMNKTTILKNETQAKNIKDINEALQDSKGFTSLLTLLQKDQTLKQHLFGKY